MTKDMTGRVRCCAPFCGRTFKDEGYNEMMCGKHWRMAGKKTRRLHKHILKRLKPFGTEFPNPTIFNPEEISFYYLLVKVENRVWERIKREAFEAAGGIA